MPVVRSRVDAHDGPPPPVLAHLCWSVRGGVKACHPPVHSIPQHHAPTPLGHTKPQTSFSLFGQPSTEINATYHPQQDIGGLDRRQVRMLCLGRIRLEAAGKGRGKSGGAMLGQWCWWWMGGWLDRLVLGPFLPCQYTPMRIKQETPNNTQHAYIPIGLLRLGRQGAVPPPHRRAPPGVLSCVCSEVCMFVGWSFLVFGWSGGRSVSSTCQRIHHHKRESHTHTPSCTPGFPPSLPWGASVGCAAARTEGAVGVGRARGRNASSSFRVMAAAAAAGTAVAGSWARKGGGRRRRCGSIRWMSMGVEEEGCVSRSQSIQCTHPFIHKHTKPATLPSNPPTHRIRRSSNTRSPHSSNSPSSSLSSSHANRAFCLCCICSGEQISTWS